MFNVVFKNYETWLICGGRNFADQAMFDDVMSRLMEMWGCPECVVHGGATGADAMAGKWASQMAIGAIEVKADWQLHGPAAGPIRNELMLTDHKPKRVIAFPGGKGTADMVTRARKRPEVDVAEIKATLSPTQRD